MSDTPLSRNIAAFVAYLEERQSVGHAWHDARDCVRFSVGAAAQISSKEPLVDLSWSTRKEALIVCKNMGGIEAAMDLHYDRVAPALAMRGDIAGVVDDRWGVHLMVVEGAMLVGPGENGLVRLPRNQMIVAWDAMSIRSSSRQSADG